MNVKYLGRDSKGRYLISRKALLPLPADRAVPHVRSRPTHTSRSNFEVGSVLEGTITEVRDYGFMVELAPGETALLHNSKLSHTFVSSALAR